jgi:hypothetical protein
VLSGFPTAATTEVGDIDGAPLGVLSGFLTSATTDAEDVNDGPLGGCCQDFWQRSPPKMETSMAKALGVLSGFLTAATMDVKDVDGTPPRGDVGAGGPGAPTGRVTNLHEYDR